MNWNEFDDQPNSGPQPEVRAGYCRGLARKELNLFYGALSLANLPVNVVAICRRNGIAVEALQQCDDDHSAIVIPEIKAIGYNANHHHHRTRFSIAHELGHFRAGHDPDEDDDRRRACDDREADIFAGELLVPLELLKAAVKAKIPVPKLLDLFNVSREMFFIQLKVHRLLGKI